MAKALSNHQVEALFADGMLRDPKKLKAENTRRKRPVHLISVAHSEVGTYEARGWTIQKSLKTRTKLQKQKTHGELLEDEVWQLFYNAGFHELNGPQFSLPYQRDNGVVEQKQIDVIAKDETTILVCECKSRGSRGRRSLQKDLQEIKAYKSEMAGALNRYYGQDRKPKIVWLMATRNIVWSEPDLERANSENIKVVTENELSYYDAFLKHMGPAGRYQLLAEFLSGQKIPGLGDNKVPAVKGRVGKYTYYSFVASPRQLFPVSFVNHLALNHPDGQPAYQRMVKRARLRKIQQFIEAGGYFPTNIILNFTQACRFDQIADNESGPHRTKYGWLYLPDRYKSAWLVDGQHRLYGYSFADESTWDSSIFVLAFEKMDASDEADLFITINHEQKSVPRSILEALKADLKWGSDVPKDRLDALHSSIVKRLNAQPTSPLFQRMVIEGVTPDDQRCLTIPEFMKGLKRSQLIGKVVHDVLVPGPLSSTTDDKTIERACKVINGYFTEIERGNPERWSAGRKGLVAINVGMRSHLLLLSQIITDVASREHIDPVEESEEFLLDKVREKLEPVKKHIERASEEEIQEEFGRKFGEGGMRTYFFNLCELIAKNDENFGPPGFKEYLSQKYDSRRKGAHQDVIHITETMMDVVRKRLIELYGDHRLESGEEAFWEYGIKDKQIKERAYRKQMDDASERKMLKIAYLDVLDVKKIVRQPENWEHFKDLFNLPLPGEKGKTYYLDWMDKFNELRRVPAHASGLRIYTEEDYKFLEWVKENFLAKCQNHEREG